MKASLSLLGLLLTIAVLNAAIRPEPAVLNSTTPAPSIAGPIPDSATPLAVRIKQSIDYGSRRDPRPKPPRPRLRPFIRPETTDGAIGINFEDLWFDRPADQPFSTAMFTARIRELLGRRVAIRGFIHPVSALTEKDLTKFLFVPDDQSNVGPGYWLDDNIVVEFVPGRSTDFSVRPITVVGKLSAKPWVEPVGTISVYHLEAESVIPPPNGSR